MTNHCQDCRHWQTDLGGVLRERFLSRPPEGWRLCVITSTYIGSGRFKPKPGQRAVALETDASLAVMATAPDFGCVDWEEVPANERMLLALDGLELSTRAHNCLTLHLKCKTVGDVTQFTAKRLMMMPNFGPHSLADVRQALAGFGLALAGDEPPQGDRGGDME